MFVFFFKQKTAYEMRISDWSSDVCSSDLAQTTVTGAYIVAGLPVGTYDVIAAAADGTVGSGEISVGAGDATLDLTLAPGEAVTGTVVDADTGAPVAGARITTTATVPGRDPVSSGSDGRFTLDGMPPGSLDIWARADGYAPATGAAVSGRDRKSTRMNSSH